MSLSPPQSSTQNEAASPAKEIGSLRLCFVTPTYPQADEACGGLSSYLRRTTRALAARGHEVHVITAGENELSREHAGVTIHETVPIWDAKMRVDKIDRLVPKTAYMAYQNVKLAWALWRRWKTLRDTSATPFDAVQIANPRSSGLFFGGERAVFTTTRLSNHAQIWDEAVNLPTTIGRRIEWWLDRVAVRATRAVYGPCERVARLVEKDYQVNSVEVIEPPFFEEFNAAGTNVPESTTPPYAVFFGGLTRMKGLHVLAEALPAIAAACPDFQLRLFGLGEHTLETAPLLCDLVRKHPELHDHLELSPALPPAELYPIIAAARLVVLPSIIDNTPNTLLESMALRRPVVGLQDSGFEQFLDGSNGVLADRGKPGELAAVVERVWNLPTAEREAMGAAAAARIRQLAPERALSALEHHLSAGALQPTG